MDIGTAHRVPASPGSPGRESARLCTATAPGASSMRHRWGVREEGTNAIPGDGHDRGGGHGGTDRGGLFGGQPSLRGEHQAGPPGAYRTARRAATLAAVRADAADYLSLASAGQFAITYQMLSAHARQAISQQAWVAVHQTCAGTSYKIKHLAVAGKTATVTVGLAGGHRGTLTETLVYVAGSWGVSPGDVRLYQHGSVAADVAAAKAGGNCAS